MLGCKTNVYIASFLPLLSPSPVRFLLNLINFAPKWMNRILENTCYWTVGHTHNMGLWTFTFQCVVDRRRSSSSVCSCFPSNFSLIFSLNKRLCLWALFFSLSISQYNRENQTLNNGIEAKQLFIIEEEEWINEQTAKSAQCVCVNATQASLIKNSKFSESML